MKTHLYKYALAAFLLLTTIVANAQRITTIAGNHIGLASGDGGPATAAGIGAPYGIYFDVLGNFFIADWSGNRVRKVNSSGIITTIAGNGTGGYSGDLGPATAAQLSKPLGITGDTLGNLFITDQYNNVIRKVDTSGIITTIAGNSISGFSGDGGQATSAELSWPSGITIDRLGNLYFADRNNWRLRKINTSGIITTVAGNGTYAFSGDGGPATAASFSGAFWPTVDDTGNLYIADGSQRIRKVDTSGIVNTIAGTGVSGFGGDGGPATAALFQDIYGLFIDTAGNIFVGDGNNNRLRKIDKSGIISTIAGTGILGYKGDNGPATAAELYQPSCMISDGCNIYFSDHLNAVIRKIDCNDNRPYVTDSSTLESSSILNPIGNLSILPNPNSGSFTLKGSLNLQTDENVSINVTNIFGQVIYANAIAVKNGIINAEIILDDIANGLYLLHIRSETENAVSRFVIEK